MVGITFLVGFCLNMLWPVASGERVIMLSGSMVYKLSAFEDQTEQYYAWTNEARQQLRQGEFPLWNPWSAGGYPLLANCQSKALALTTLLFLWIPDTLTAMTWAIIFLVIVSTLAIYGMCVSEKIGLAGSVAAASYFAWETIQNDIIGSPANLETRSLGVVSLFFLVLALKRKSPIWVALAAFFFGAGFYGGDIQVTYNAWLFWGIYALIAVWHKWDEQGKSEALVLFRRVMAIFILGALIGALQIFTATELVEMSTRQYVYDGIMSTRLMLREILDVMLGRVYHGKDLCSIVLVLALIGGLQRKWVPLSMLVLALLALLISNGGLFYKVIYYLLPYYDRFKIEENFIYIPYSVFVPILMAFGIERFSRWIPQLLLLLLIGPLYLYMPSYSSALVNESAIPKTVAPILPCVETLQKGKMLDRFVRYRTTAIQCNFNMVFNLADAQGYDSLLFGRYARLMNAIEPGVYADNLFDYRIRFLDKEHSLRLPALNMLNVRYVLCGEPVDVPGLSLLVSEPEEYCYAPKFGYYIYENTNVLPRAFLVAGAHVVKDIASAYQRVAAMDFKPQSCAIVTQDDAAGHELLDCPKEPVELGTATISKYRASRVEVEVNALQPAYLLLVDNKYPGWEATIDGEPAETILANGSFRLTPVGEGRHKIVYSYSPLSFLIGGTLALIGLLVCLFLSVLGIRSYWLAWRMQGTAP